MRRRCGHVCMRLEVGLLAAGFEERNVGMVMNTTVGMVRHEHGR